VVHGRRGGAAATPRRAGAGHGVQAVQAKLGHAAGGPNRDRERKREKGGVEGE